ncbi:MAG: hypothetical protein ACK522_12895 [Synechococcaceae cyanobacterium]
MPRSIYNIWSQVLEYFDASIIELPAKQEAHLCLVPPELGG